MRLLHATLVEGMRRVNGVVVVVVATLVEGMRKVNGVGVMRRRGRK